jgi:hypothetical protein
MKMWNGRSEATHKSTYLKQDKFQPMNPGEPPGRYGLFTEATGKKYPMVTIYHALCNVESWNLVPEHFFKIYID